MLRKESEAVPEGNGPVPQQVGSGEPTLADVCTSVRRIKEILDRRIDVITRLLEQHLTSLEQDARQPRVVMEAGGPADTKTRERTEGTATAVQAMHRDSWSAARVDPGPKTNSTSFGIKVEPPTFPCREDAMAENGDVMVENGDASLKSCLPSLEVRSPSAVGGLLPDDETSTTTKIPFNRSPPRLYLSEEMYLKTSAQLVSYDSSFWNLLAVPSCPRVIEKKTIQSRTFDPSGSQGCLRACLFLGTWRAFLCGEVMRMGADGDELQRSLED